jgi:hypothetical protein
MVSQKALTRSDSRSNHTDQVNKIVDRDKGNTWDLVIWRPDSPSYGLDLDNAQGNHANFGGVLLVTDTAITASVPLEIRGFHELRLYNTANTNSVNLYHINTTNDVMKTDDSFTVAVALTVGATNSATDAGDIAALGGLSVGSYTNPSAGQILGTGGLSIGTYANASAGQILGTAGLAIGTYANATGGMGYLSGGLSVGGTPTPQDPGDIYGSGGASFGTYVNPAAGQIVASGSLNLASTISATDPGDAYVAGGVTAGTYANPTAGQALFTGGLAVGTYVNAAAGYGWFSGALNASLISLFAKGIQVTGGDTPAAVGSVIKTAAGGLALRAVTGSSADFVLVDAANTTNMIENLTGTATLRFNGGGLMVGTVAAQGSGTINVATNLFKNGTAYTNPDFVFEHYYTGRIERFAHHEGAADYLGLMTLPAVRAFVSSRYHLPRIPHDGAPAGIFDRADWLLEHVESLYLHLFEMHDRLSALEARSAAEL